MGSWDDDILKQLPSLDLKGEGEGRMPVWPEGAGAGQMGLPGRSWRHTVRQPLPKLAAAGGEERLCPAAL